MSGCTGRLADGTACTSEVYDCSGCGARGCAGFACENQRFSDSVCDTCGGVVGPAQTLVAGT